MMPYTVAEQVPAERLEQGLPSRFIQNILESEIQDRCERPTDMVAFIRKACLRSGIRARHFTGSQSGLKLKATGRSTEDEHADPRRHISIAAETGPTCPAA